MTLKFKIRVSKKTKEGDYSPIYVRLYDGAICDQTVKTRCMVQPHFWDQKGQCIKYRCLCPEKERDTITSELLGIRSYLTSKYNECKQQGKSISDAWVLKTLTQCPERRLRFRSMRSPAATWPAVPSSATSTNW